MCDAALKAGDSEKMQLWAGQAAKLAQAQPAATIVQHLWEGARQLLV